jgi:Cdc6-like AAA superfamily ATPase
VRWRGYRLFCPRADQRPLTARAFGDLVSEQGLYSLIRVCVLSCGRYGRSRDIVLELPRELEDRIYDTILLNFGLKQSHATITRGP